MKKVFCIFASLSFFCLPFATSYAAVDLQQTMKSMGEHFKMIVLNAKDVSKYPTLANEALGLQDDVLVALTAIPEKINLMTDADAKRAARIEFRNDLSQVLGNAIALEAALLKTNPAAADIQVVNDKISAITQLMKEGHKVFKKP